jgi:nucleotide-binding universal stress UspA family protein
MTMNQPCIIVGCDASPDSERAFAWADRYARLTDGTLVLVAAWRWPTYQDVPLTYGTYDPRKVAASRLRRLAAQSGLPPARLQRHVDRGDPAKVLVEHCAQCDLLVVGSHGHGPFTRALLGSVSSKCASCAACPVVIVRADAADSRERQGVLVGVDGSASAYGALRWAMDYADVAGEPLTVMTCAPSIAAVPHGYVMDLPAPTDEMSDGLQGWIAELVAKAEADRGRAVAAGTTTRVEVGSPPAALIDCSATARLTVVGRRGIGGFQRLIVGSVASALMHHAEGDVVVTPAM